MLFSYKFFTLSQSFSQLPNKFYIRKSTITHTPASIENPPPPTPPRQQQKNQRLKREKLRDWGKERSIFSGGDKISLGWWRREQDARLRSRWWQCWSTAYGRLSRSELNPYLSVHGLWSVRWILGVYGSVMREGWAEIRDQWWVFVLELGWEVMRDRWWVFVLELGWAVIRDWWLVSELGRTTCALSSCSLPLSLSSSPSPGIHLKVK